MVIWKAKVGYFVKTPEEIASKFLNELVIRGSSSRFMDLHKRDYEWDEAKEIINSFEDCALTEAFVKAAKKIEVNC